ncbi:aminotransferase class I/II-fold pyridoxal phosphate-dependent enzyme [Treponema sp. OMZ 840]|uniref:aminotransferase class I/II-fold pyridoxal phosphate-dependent enzyme n=1 Tax=Treponema sp. OMZ 840 TaxID=244313 RepID=UPI003D9432EA
MQALMLAAGMGKRLGPYTQNATKCMVPVNGKTLIEYCIEALLKAGIHKLVMVIGYKGEVLQKFLDNKYSELELVWIENPVYDKTNNIYSLFLASEELKKDDTILLESDLIFDPAIIGELVNSSEPNLAVVSHFEPWMDGTVTLLDKEHNITGMLNKKQFVWKNIKDYYKTVNIYKLSKEFSAQYYIPFLTAYQKAYGQNEYYEQVLKVISFLDSTKLRGHPVSGERWYEIDDMQDLAIASNRFAEKEKKLELMQKRYGGYWRFPALLDYCYLVNPYFPPKKLVKELKANFKTLLTQYPSGGSEQSLLAGKIFGISPEKTVVGNGAAELISALCPYVKPPFLTVHPTFNEYPERFKKQFGEAALIPLHADSKTIAYDAADIINALDEAEKSGSKIQTLLLINPDNPSGNFIAKDKVLTLLDYCAQKGIVTVFDESFIDFAESAIRYTFFDNTVLEKYPDLIVIKSISKSYGVPGLRLGVLACSQAELIQKLHKEVSIWNINSFAEYFLQIIDKYKNDYKIGCDKIAEERNRFKACLESIDGIVPYQSQANYILCKLTGKMTSAELSVQLLEKYNIFIKDLSSKTGFENGQFIRLAVRSTKDNDKLTSALKEIPL